MNPWSRRRLLGGLGAGAALGIGGTFAAGGPRRAGPEAAWTPAPVPLPDGFARGMNFAHQHRRGAGYGSDAAAAQLDALVALGVRDLALNPFAYTASLDATEVRFGGDTTLTDDDLRRQIAQAHARGMRVLMKPHLWSRGYWTGGGNMDIAPADWAAWFASYTRYALHYAALAEETGCTGLCVGLEYTKATLANPGAWAAVAAACRTVFSGRLCYAANWYEEYSHFSDWDAFDCIGVNAYFPLQGRTVDALAASWDEHLDAIEVVARGKPVMFPEAGYRAIVGSTERPWESGGGAADPDLQARAYEALLRAVSKRSWFKGIYWWKWFTADGPDGDVFVPEPAAQAVLRAWF